MSSTALTKGSVGGERLRRLANADLYRTNPFRVLRLPITAATGDVRRHQRRLEMRRKLGVERSEHRGVALGPPSAPTIEETRAALDRLNDPESRVLDELFWFWPMEKSGSGDAALAAIDRGETKKAERLWRRAMLQDGRDGVATHNLAVLYHIAALDIDGGSVHGSRRKKPRPEQIDALWKRSFAQWRTLIELDGFWSRLKERVRAIDDARLTTGFVRRVREELRSMLLSINAVVGLRAAETGDADTARRHVGYLRTSGFAADESRAVLRNALAPVRDRIHALCRTSEPEADRDPKHAHRVTREFIDTARPLLAVVDLLLGDDDPVRQGLHDDVAGTALGCQISYGNETEDWTGSLALLHDMLPLVAGEAMRERLQRNIDIVTKNRELELCFHCRERQGKKGLEQEVEMHGEVTREPRPGGFRVKWKHTRIEIPRCRQCKERQEKLTRGALLSWLITSGVGALITVIVAAGGSRHDRPGILLVGALISIGAGCVLGALVQAAHPNGKRSFKEHERVRELKRQGWKFGSEPDPSEQANAPMEGDGLQQLLGRLGHHG